MGGPLAAVLTKFLLNLGCNQSKRGLVSGNKEVNIMVPLGFSWSAFVVYVVALMLCVGGGFICLIAVSDAQYRKIFGLGPVDEIRERARRPAS